MERRTFIASAFAALAGGAAAQALPAERKVEPAAHDADNLLIEMTKGVGFTRRIYRDDLVKEPNATLAGVAEDLTALLNQARTLAPRVEVDFRVAANGDPWGVFRVTAFNLAPVGKGAI